jgi:hypothetical protein
VTTACAGKPDRDVFILAIAAAIERGHAKTRDPISKARALAHAITVADKLPALFTDEVQQGDRP